MRGLKHAHGIVGTFGLRKRDRQHSKLGGRLALTLSRGFSGPKTIVSIHISVSATLGAPTSGDLKGGMPSSYLINLVGKTSAWTGLNTRLFDFGTQVSGSNAGAVPEDHTKRSLHPSFGHFSRQRLPESPPRPNRYERKTNSRRKNRPSKNHCDMMHHLHANKVSARKCVSKLGNPTTREGSRGARPNGVCHAKIRNLVAHCQLSLV